MAERERTPFPVRTAEDEEDEEDEEEEGEEDDEEPVDVSPALSTRSTLNKR